MKKKEAYAVPTAILFVGNRVGWGSLPVGVWSATEFRLQ